MGQNNIARGSEWRKWDFQVHTPASHLNNQFGSDWDVYVQNLFRAAIAKDISAIGLTDYFTIDGYKKVKEEYLSQPAKLASLFTADEIDRISTILVFPNIEFRLSRFVGPNRINCHVILSEDLSPRTIEEHFLHDLTFTNKADPQQAAEKHKLKVENLRDFGERLKSEHAAFAEHDSLFVGMMNAVVDDDDIVRALQDGRFKDKFFFCVVADEDLSKVKWDGQDHHARKILIQRSSALFASNPVTRAWALGRPPYGEGEDAFIREFKTLKPCLHGSDCHGYPEIGHPCAKKGKSGHDCSTQSDRCDLRYCWIKADTTFEGLRQILHEPGDRTFIGPTAPDYHDEARVIRSVSLSDGKGWFSDANIPLNPSMVSIIGQKGSGKSALADLIAFAAGSWDASDDDGFIRRSESHLDGMTVQLEWADGHTSTARLGDAPGEADEVHYLSQNYVNRICARDGITRELIGEIEDVIFHYLDPTETLNASSFGELRALKTEGIRRESQRLKAEIQAVISEECALRAVIATLGEKRKRATTLAAERDGLTKQLPPAVSEAEAALLAKLQTKRGELATLQQAAANEKQNLQKVIDLRTRVRAFQAQIDRFYAEIVTPLRDAGVPESDWPKFKPAFPDDLEPIFAIRNANIALEIGKLEGGDPPAEATIKRLQLDIEMLAKQETADKARQERTRQIQTRIAAIGAEAARLDAEIKNIVEVEAPKLSDMRSRRLQAYVAYFENRTQEQVALASLYEPIRDQLAEQALLKGKELDFIIKWSANLGNWLERGSALFDQRRTIPYSTFDKLGQEARRLLVPAWTSGDPARISAAFDEFMGEFRKPDLEWQSYARSGVTFQDILSWLYEVDHIQLDYGLKFNGADLESLSPGTKGIVLLILYLGMDTNDTRPLIVDQPDENLDNESIYTLLTPYFRLAKVRRQIIVITHNPNLVVNSDSEQVIIAHADKQPNGLPTISYVAGGLEDDRPTKGIRHQVCSILEGGNDAFRKRERRYALAQ